MTNNFNFGRRKEGQVTIFIIIAIVLVVSIVAIVLLRDRVTVGGLPREILPVYEYFLSCVEDETKIGADLMGSQAGYIEVPEFVAGSEYMPFSSQLNFLGYGVPYWYYVSGNGIAKEQMPSASKMEAQLEEYLEERVDECDFSSFEAQGFVINKGEPDIKVGIEDREIEVEIEMPFEISFGEIAGRQTTHTVSVNSKLGRFYSIAKKIYEKEKNSLFLENYGIDVLRLYAPVDGVEITCSPEVWLQQDIKKELGEALEGNIQAIKVKGNYYSLDADDKGYFVQDIGGSVGESVNFLYSKQWPTKIQIYPDENPLIAEPVGLEEGLGVLGFCYVPYHFVYDMAYPVLIQIYDVEEMFQFPIGVVIDKNKPIEGLDVEALPPVVPELCEHKLTEINVYTYDTQLDSVEADISFKCFDTKCDIGKTKLTGADAYLRDLFPQCVNGFIVARADGYATKKYMLSTVESATANVVLNKLYDLDLEIFVGGELLDGERAVVYFDGEDRDITIAYPEQQEVRLSEGQYDVEVFVYKNSSLSFAGSTTRTCIDVPKSGILGIFGTTEEQCYDIDVPAQTISFAIAGGGKVSHYILESELMGAEKLKIRAESLPAPTSLEQLQDNYNLLEEKTLWLEFS